MRVRRALWTTAALALAACDNATPTGQPDGPLRTDNAAVETTANSATASEAGDLPEIGPGPRFVGKWAANEEMCQAQAWQFTDSTLRTPAGSSCSFNRVTEVDGGYDIQATCTAEGPPTSDTLKLRFEEEAKGMRFESDTVADSSLVFCGRDA